MKYLIIFLLAVIASCGHTKKVIHNSQTSVDSTNIFWQNSSVREAADSTVTHKDSSSHVSTTDSSYDKEVNESIIEWIGTDSLRPGQQVKMKQTTRTILEKGRRTTEIHLQTSNMDSNSKKNTVEQGAGTSGEKTVHIFTAEAQKQVDRSTIQWWLWLLLIAAGVGLIAWGYIKRAPLLKTLKNLI